MISGSILALAGLMSTVAAVPAVRRDIVWVTEIDEAVVVVPVTTTIWVDPTPVPSQHMDYHVGPAGTASPADPAGPAASDAPSNHWPVQQSSQDVQPAAPTTTTSSAYVPPTAPTTPISQYVASTTAQYVAPTTSQSSPSSSWIPSSPSQAASSTSSSSASNTSPSGATYSGALTWYNTSNAAGSCGPNLSDSGATVAISIDTMTSVLKSAGKTNTNDNPWCRQSITIHYGANTTTATIMDSCSACQGYDLDLTPALFEDLVGDLGVGRTKSDMTWSFN